MTTLNEFEYLLDFLIYKARGVDSTPEYYTIKNKLDYILAENLEPEIFLEENDQQLQLKGCDNTPFRGNTRWIPELTRLIDIYRRGGIASVYAYTELSDGGSNLNADVVIIKSDYDEERMEVLKDIEENYIVFDTRVFEQVFKIPVEHMMPFYRLPFESFLVQLMLYTDGMIIEKQLKKNVETRTFMDVVAPYLMRKKIKLPKKVYTREERDFFKYNTALRDKFNPGQVPHLQQTTQYKASTTCNAKAKKKIKDLFRTRRGYLEMKQFFPTQKI